MRRVGDGTSAAPILVTGAHRSGTTWVGRMLALDATVAYMHEPFNPTYDKTRLRAPTPRAFTFISAANADHYRYAVREMLNHRWQAQLPKVRRSPRIGLRLLAETFNDRRRQLRPLIKDPLALLAAPWLTEAFGMQSVVMVRHPAGFVSSILRLGWKFDFNDLAQQPALLAGPLASEAELINELVAKPASDLDQAAHLWRILNGFISRVPPLPQWQVYRHEDLAAQPLPAFEDLYARLGLHLTESIRDEIVASNSVTPQDEVDATDIRRSSVAQASSWRKRLQDHEVARIRSLTEEVASTWYSSEAWMR